MNAAAISLALPPTDRGLRLSDVAVRVPVSSGQTPVMDVNGWFHDDPELQAVVVDLGGKHWLLSRDRLESELNGRLGYGRALNSRTKLNQLAPDDTLVLAPGLTMPQAAQRILQRPSATRYHDFLVIREDGPAAVSVSRIFEALAAVFQHDAFHDPLTGLPNRRLLDEQGQELIGKCAPSRVAILCIDLDSFKPINDAFGHRAGDEVLVGFTRRLRQCVRGSDVLARLGGDEFAALLIGVDPEQARRIADRVLAAVQAPFRHDGQELQVSASIGLAMASDVVREAKLSQLDVLLRHADGAMLEAKRAGKGRVVWLSERREAAPFARRAQICRRLQLAAERGTFRLHYQSQLDLVTGERGTVEALLRWDDDVLGLVSPAEFIPIAESSGLIQRIGRWVFDEACAQARMWLDAGTPRAVSINVSPLQLAGNRLVDELTAAIDLHQLPPSLVRVEITESTAIADSPQAISQLRQLQELGVGIDLDDFGTGYSSIGLLRDLPLNAVKIDKSFIDRVDRTEREAAFVGGVIDAAHALGLKVTAEGIERSGQLHVLRRLGCDTAQGFLIARPAAAADLADGTGVGELALAGFRPARQAVVE